MLLTTSYKDIKDLLNWSCFLSLLYNNTIVFSYQTSKRKYLKRNKNRCLLIVSQNTSTPVTFLSRISSTLNLEFISFEILSFCCYVEIYMPYNDVEYFMVDEGIPARERTFRLFINTFEPGSCSIIF